MLIGQRLGPFLIEKELGSGAMGTVFLGSYSKTGQLVALKVMLPGMGSSDSASERFEREGAILKQLNHPNIVRLFGIGKYQGTRYYAMEYIEGETLDKVLARKGRLTWEEVVDLGKQLCAALQHAADKGVIHRDLKPSNLMIAKDGTLKLTDFGIAKDLDQTGLTATNCTVGTAAYMSPEQCKGERELTHKSDLYSLGIVFYELVTGRKPFTADNAMEMFLQHVQGKFERPSRLVLDLPPWFDTLICQMMEKKPEQRPYNAAKVAEALNTIQEKVEALQSAGVDAVKKRRVDRLADERTTDFDADKGVAQVLIASGKGKKKKKKTAANAGPPVWMRVAGLLMLFCVVAGCIVWAFLPKSPEQLYKEAERQMPPASKDPVAWEKARNGPIKEYLTRYGASTDAQAQKMREWQRFYDLYECGQIVQAALDRPKFAGEPKNDAEKDVFAAARAEAAGNLGEAQKKWDEARTTWNEASGFHLWGLYAAQRLQPYKEMDDLESQLIQVSKTMFDTEKDPGLQGVQKLALDAQRYEDIGDAFNASERYKEIRDKTKDDAERKSLYLLSLKKIDSLKAKAEEQKSLDARLKMVKKLLDDTETDPKLTRVEKRKWCQEVIALYGKMDGFGDLVNRAEMMIKKK